MVRPGRGMWSTSWNMSFWRLGAYSGTITSSALPSSCTGPPRESQNNTKRVSFPLYKEDLKVLSAFRMRVLLCQSKTRMRKADSTLRSSRAVPHPSTNRALRRLTSEVRRDPVHSTRYGRQRNYSRASSDPTRLSRIADSQDAFRLASRAEKLKRPANSGFGLRH